MNSQELRHFKLLFSVFGFERFTENNKITNCWVSCHGCFAILQVVLILLYRNEIMYTYDLIGEVSDVLKLLSTFCAYFAAIYVSWSSKRYDKNVSFLVKNIKILMEKFHVNVDEVHKSCYKSLAKKCFLIVIVHLFGVLITVAFQHKETQSMLYTCAFTLAFVFCYVKQLQGILYVEIINHYFEVLNGELEKLNELITCNEKLLLDKIYGDFLFKRLKLCRNFYGILYELKEQENIKMGPIMFINQINFYVHILSSIYWATFRTFNQTFEPMICKNYCDGFLQSILIFLISTKVAPSMASILLDASVIIFLSDVSERTGKLHKYTAHQLHRIVYCRCFMLSNLNDLVS